MSKRKQHTPEFMANVALEALKGEETVTELASRFGVYPTMIHQWKRVLLGGRPGCSNAAPESGARKKPEIDEEQVRELHAKIGAAAPSLDQPAAINSHNCRRSFRRVTPGRPGVCSAALVQRSDLRLPLAIATSFKRVLRGPVETAQFTSFLWTNRLRRSGVRISMDGKARFHDNIFIQRLLQTLKCECVYLHAWETGWETKAGIRKWMTFYNRQRPHSALGGRPPAVVYWQ